MPDEIRPDLFVHLVELAALELAPEEGEYVRGQLNGQLKAIHELERIPVPEDVPAAAHGVMFPRKFARPFGPTRPAAATRLTRSCSKPRKPTIGISSCRRFSIRN